MNTSTRIVCTVVTLLLAAFGMFYQLGHYALWDDEADTAIHAKGVLLTGDTSTVIGHNFYAYRGGVALKNGMDRVSPPLGSYLAAAVIPILGDSAGAVRFPFALFGFLTVALMLWWLYKDDASPTMWVLVCIATLCNVSLFLFSRNCRYYGPVIFASTALAYLYLHWAGTARQRVLWVLASLVIVTGNYMVFIAVYVSLLLDYLFFGRGEIKASLKDLCWTLIPLGLLAAPVVWIWNPLTTEFGRTLGSASGMERFTLLWWNIRDTNICEFYVAGLVVIAAILAWRMKDAWLRRALVTMGGYILVLTLVSPQPVKDTMCADVRYALPLIPLGIFIGARTLFILGHRMPAQVAMLGAAVFFTNVLNGGMLLRTGFHSGIALFVRELFQRPEDPYTVVADWINQHVKEGESIWVQPTYMVSPLIYHAPKAIYAWQLNRPAEGQFKGLSPINFCYESEPDYMIGFGPGQLPAMRKEIHKRKVIKSRYIQTEVLTCYSRDLFRPELFWRNFGKDAADDGLWGVVIYKRVPLAPEVEDSMITPKY